MRTERYEIALPHHQTGTVEIRADLERLARDLWWKAYWSKLKRATLHDGAVVVTILSEGTPSAEGAPPRPHASSCECCRAARLCHVCGTPIREQTQRCVSGACLPCCNHKHTHQTQGP